MYLITADLLKILKGWPLNIIFLHTIRSGSTLKTEPVATNIRVPSRYRRDRALISDIINKPNYNN